MEYKFEFQRWFFDTDNFKQKQVDNILGIINGGRLLEFMKFVGYGNITYAPEDHGHRYPTITELDKFNRLKSNCMIFDLTYNTYNNGKFDKCFIYQSNGRQIGNYGFVFYNTETGKLWHKYFIDYSFDGLCQALTKSFHAMLRDEVWLNYYGKKYDAVKKRNGLTLKDCPTIKDYERCLENLNKRYEIGKPKFTGEEE